MSAVVSASSAVAGGATLPIPLVRVPSLRGAAFMDRFPDFVLASSLATAESALLAALWADDEGIEDSVGLAGPAASDEGT